jgi:predicted phosphoribosyltransferase
MLVDDGLATGATMMAAVRSLHRKAAKTIIAVPVGTAEACERLEREVDGLICLHIPEPFYAVGMYYQHFEATTDAEVLQLLEEHHAQRTPRADAPEA